MCLRLQIPCRVGINSRSIKSLILLGFCRLYMLFDNKMAKTIFEEMGGTYVRQGDYNLPCLSLPTEKGSKPVGVWGQRHLRYLKQHRKVLYTNLLTSGKLNSYLADIDKQAEDMFLRLVEQIANREGVTEQLKAENQIEWVGRMNNIRNRAMEIVNSELIYV